MWNRRKFAFGIGLGLFQIYQKTGLKFVDNFAASMMDLVPLDTESSKSYRWKYADNRSWFWFRRLKNENGKWVVDGITRPVHKSTDELAKDDKRYLDSKLVPFKLRMKYATPNEFRKQRHGRPPSRWLRSLTEGEIRIWLKTIEVGESGVEGMTFFTHLTRDHMFEAESVKGLSESEQEKLHSAAHEGY